MYIFAYKISFNTDANLSSNSSSIEYNGQDRCNEVAIIHDTDTQLKKYNLVQREHGFQRSENFDSN